MMMDRKLVTRIIVASLVIASIAHVPLVGGAIQSNCEANDNVSDRITAVSFCTNSIVSNQESEVTVYDEDGDMPTDVPPAEAGDMDSDIWVIDSDFDGDVELVIDFESNQQIETRFGTFAGTAAYLYDDSDGDGSVDYKVQRRGIDVNEAEHWSIAVVNRDGGSWVSEQGINYNFSILVDKEPPSRAKFIRTSRLARLNGNVGYVTNYYDHDADRNIDAQINLEQQYPSSVSRSGARIYHGNKTAIDDYDLFPFLAGPFREEQPSYSFPGPPIRVNWKNGTIADLQNILGANREEIEAYNARQQRIQLAETNMLYFEIPFNWYNLAADDDGYGELVARAVYGEPHRSTPGDGPPELRLRYSWDQDNDNTYDYRVSYISRHVYRQTVELPDFRIRSVPYEQYTEFITEKENQGVVFVDTNGNAGGSSEGIYEGAFTQRMGEVISQPNKYRPLEEFVPPVIGWRAEYAKEPSVSGKLYLSPVDGKLHLRNADQGRWIINGTPSKQATLNFDYSMKAQREGVSPALEIRYFDRNDDGYIDTWSKYSNNNRRSQIVYSKPYLIYYDVRSATINVKTVGLPTKVWEGDAPSNHTEWKAMRDRLDNRSESQSDLQQLFSQANGSRVLTISGGEYRRFVETNGSLAVHADISRESRVVAENDSITLPQSSQVVFILNQTEDIRVERLTAPSLSIENFSAPNVIAPLERTAISVKIRNSGWDTADNVSVAIVNENEIVTNTKVTVPGKETNSLQLHWWPRSDYKDVRIVVRYGDQILLRERISATKDQKSLALINRYQIGNRSIYLTLGAAIAIIAGIILTTRRVIQ